MSNIIYLNSTPVYATAPVKLTDSIFYDPVPKKRSQDQEPIKNPEHIDMISQWFIDHGQYRDNLIFILGINTGFRAGDILSLKVGHLINHQGAYHRQITLQEEKTKNKNKNKRRTCYLNEAVLEAAHLYFSSLAKNEQALDINDYLFTSEGPRPSNGHLDRDHFAKVLKKVINKELGLDIRCATHCMRKTFSYHVLMNASDRSRALELLQGILGHKSVVTTLRYAGITDDEFKNTYASLNLGSSKKLDIRYALA